MKSLIKTFAVLSLFIAVLPLHANHLLGGSMTYKFLTDTKLEFTLVVYRDCQNGISPFDNPAPIGIYQETNGAFSLIEMYQAPLTQSQLISATANSCGTQVPSGVCIEKGTYVFSRIIPFTGSNDHFYVVYQRCCWANNIINILEPNLTGITIYAEITPEAFWNNADAPQFPSDPFMIACPHEKLQLDLHAATNNADSVFYTLCPPNLGGGSVLSGPGLFGCDGAVPMPPCPPPYNPASFVVPNFTAQQPFGEDTSYHFDAHTGTLSVIPPYLGIFVYAECIKQYRAGLFIGSFNRALPLWVADDSLATRVHEIADEPLHCTPNPASTTVDVDPGSFFAGETAVLTVQDAEGRIVETRSVAGGVRIFLSVGHWPTGVYTIRCESPSRVARGRFVVHR